MCFILRMTNSKIRANFEQRPGTAEPQPAYTSVTLMVHTVVFVQAHVSFAGGQGGFVWLSCVDLSLRFDLSLRETRLSGAAPCRFTYFESLLRRWVGSPAGQYRSGGVMSRSLLPVPSRPTSAGAPRPNCGQPFPPPHGVPQSRQKPCLFR